MTTRYSRAYLLTKVLTADRREVVLYLYEGALNYLGRALDALENNDAQTFAEFTDRTVAILIELSGSLDYNQNGSLAVRLDGLYNFMIELLTNARESGEADSVKTCESIMAILGDAWRQALELDRSNASEPAQLRLSA